MLISGFLFAGVTLIYLVLLFVTSIVLIAGSIVLICFINKQKKAIKEKGIEDGNIRKTKLMAIFSILTAIFSCLGCVILFLPIISAVKSGKAKKMLNEGNATEAIKKTNSALTLLMISNIVTLSLVVLNLYSCGDLVMFPLTMLISFIFTKI